MSPTEACMFLYTITDELTATSTLVMVILGMPPKHVKQIELVDGPKRLAGSNVAELAAGRAQMKWLVGVLKSRPAPTPTARVGKLSPKIPKPASFSLKVE